MSVALSFAGDRIVVVFCLFRGIRIFFVSTMRVGVRSLIDVFCVRVTTLNVV